MIKKIFSNTLKVLKTLRDMHKNLMESIKNAGNCSLTKSVLNNFPKLVIPGFLSSYFFIRVYLVVYVGVVKIARIMLQVKVSNTLYYGKFKI